MAARCACAKPVEAKTAPVEDASELRRMAGDLLDGAEHVHDQRMVLARHCRAVEQWLRGAWTVGAHLPVPPAPQQLRRHQHQALDPRLNQLVHCLHPASAVATVAAQFLH